MLELPLNVNLAVAPADLALGSGGTTLSAVIHNTGVWGVVDAPVWLTISEYGTTPGTPATDVAAEQIGAHVGCEVVERGWGYAWRRVGAAKDAYGAWARWVDGYKTKYERVVTEMATFGALLEYRGPEGVRNLLFDDGDSFEAVVQAAVVLREAARVEQALADAAEAGDDLKVAEVLGALRDRCVDFLVHGHFRKRSSSGASNLVAIIDGEMRGRIADMAGALVTDLRGKAR